MLRLIDVKYYTRAHFYFLHFDFERCCEEKYWQEFYLIFNQTCSDRRTYHIQAVDSKDRPITTLIKRVGISIGAGKITLLVKTVNFFMQYRFYSRRILLDVHNRKAMICIYKTCCYLCSFINYTSRTARSILWIFFLYVKKKEWRDIISILSPS